VLPLPPKKRFAVIGPLGNATQDLLGNYYEWACPLSESDFSCIPSLFDSFQTQDVSSVQYAQGCDLIDPSIQNISAAVELAAAADYVILAIGINNSVCGEGQDRSNIDLPGAQLNLTLALLAVGKPTVVLLFNGGQLAIEDIVWGPRTARDSGSLLSWQSGWCSGSRTAIWIRKPMGETCVYHVLQQYHGAAGARRYEYDKGTWPHV
jgi:beta-glucosidase